MAKLINIKVEIELPEEKCLTAKEENDLEKQFQHQFKTSFTLPEQLKGKEIVVIVSQEKCEPNND